MPTTRRILSGVASALVMARRIQAGLAANIRPSSTNRIPTPMRKSVNAMDLIGWQPPVSGAFRAYGSEATSASLHLLYAAANLTASARRAPQRAPLPPAEAPPGWGRSGRKSEPAAARRGDQFALSRFHKPSSERQNRKKTGA